MPTTLGMHDLITLVRMYRLTPGLAERLRLADEIFGQIEPKLRAFVFSSVTNDAAKDALQEVLKAVALSMKGFKGNTEKEFWGLCYQIARNKLCDHFREKYRERVQPLPPDELLRIVDASAQSRPISPGLRHDLEYVIKLLTAAKPDCADLLWKFYAVGMDYNDIAEERASNYDNVRMKIGRCLEEVKKLVKEDGFEGESTT
jgi:DNA-directed RNA polymerase specialized sigma24 family protein